MITIELNEKELELLNNDKNAIKNILVSKAIYNESYNHTFSDDEKIQIKYLEQNEAIKYFMTKTVEPRLSLNENTIIDEYNNNKAYFEENKINFAQARELIIQKLTQEINYGLEQDLVTNLVHNMDDSVTLSKEDILFTKGDPNLIKAIMLFELLKKEAKKTNFFEENKEEIDDLYKNVRIRFFVEKICSENIKVTQEEVSKFYVDNTKTFENITLEQASSQIYNHLFQEKFAKNVEEYTESIAKKYYIDEEVKKYLKDSNEVVN